MKKIVVVLLMMLFLVSLSGCKYYYKGKYIELFTCAMYSIPDAKGMMWLGEVVRDPVIEVLEQDDYGRTLFYYCEDYNKSIYALVICQTYNETSVYFYPDVNYVLNYFKYDGDYNNKIAE